MGLVADIRARWTALDIPLLHVDGHSWSRRDLLDRVRAAGGLLDENGVVAGDVVALQADRGPDFLAVFLGALSRGVTVLLLNGAYTAAEVRFLTSDANARFAVLQPGSEVSRPHLLARDLAAALDAATGVPIDGDDDCESISEDCVAALCYTSGTTGRPKGAVIRHRNIAGTVVGLHTAWGWSDRDVLVHALPLFHIHGLFVAMLGALWAGAQVVLLPRFTAEGVLAAVHAHSGTLFMGVPTFYHRLLALEEVDAPASMRLWTSGSAPLPAPVWEAFADRFGAEILERYGMTEVGIVLSNPLDGDRVPGSVGFPLPGVRARVTDRHTGAPVPSGTVGELRIHSPGLVSHYLGLPEKSGQSIVSDDLGRPWMRTGDLATQDRSGRFRIVGRMGDMVISGGLNVYPREVETVLLDHPHVAEVAVVGVADPDWGERVVALVVPAVERADASAILHLARQHLAAFKVPKAVRFAETLPRNSMGKVQKHRIRSSWSTP